MCDSTLSLPSGLSRKGVLVTKIPARALVDLVFAKTSLQAGFSLNNTYFNGICDNNSMVFAKNSLNAYLLIPLWLKRVYEQSMLPPLSPLEIQTISF